MSSKKQKSQRLRLLAGAFFVLAATASAEFHFGNGGDPLELMVFQARDAAEIMVLSTSTDSLADADQTTRDWVMTNRYLIADDVHRRKHEWLEQAPWTTCFRTNVTEQGFDPEVIYLLRSACHAEILDEDGAATLLIHESLHHLGILDEARAHATSRAIFLAWRKSLDLSKEHWESKPTLADAPERRGYHTAVWTGKDMLVWGGCHESETSLVDCGIYLNNGASYDTASNKWTALPEVGAPESRAYHTAVWTGDSMIVWGGCTGGGDACDKSLASGGVWHTGPNARWTDTKTDGAPSPRVFHSAVWDGRSMLVWGGLAGYKDPETPDRALADGAAYDPQQDHWTALPTAPIEARREHTALFTGTGNSDASNDRLMIVWGGCGTYADLACERYFADGAIFDAKTREWRAIPAPNASLHLEGRRGHTAVWTGKQMIVWGGEGANGYLSSGAAFDPESMRWSPLAPLPPEARGYHAAAWTGSRMLIWGGIDGIDSYPEELGEFVPGAESATEGEWFVSELRRTPFGSRRPTAVWTGKGLLVWGGETTRYTYLDHGGIYIPGLPGR